MYDTIILKSQILTHEQVIELIRYCQLCDKTLILLEEDVCDNCNNFIHDLDYKSIKIKGVENKLKQQVKANAF